MPPGSQVSAPAHEVLSILPLFLIKIFIPKYSRLPPAQRGTLTRCGNSSWPEVCRPKAVRKMFAVLQYKPIFTGMESLLFFSRLLVVNIGLKRKPEALII